MRCHFSFVFEFRQYAPGQLLAKFDAPLVERENIPYDTLYEYLVLVHGDESSKCFGREPFEKYGVGRAVAVEDLEFFQEIYFFVRFPGFFQFFYHDLFRFAESQSFGLGEKVGQELFMVVAGRG